MGPGYWNLKAVGGGESYRWHPSKSLHLWGWEWDNENINHPKLTQNQRITKGELESEWRRERWRWQWRFGGFHRPSTSPFVASSMAVPSITWFFLSRFPVWMLRKYRKRRNSGRTFGGSKLVYLFSFSYILWASGFLWKCLFCFWWSIFRFGFIFQASLPNEAVYEKEKSRVTVSELVFHLLIFFLFSPGMFIMSFHLICSVLV